MMTYLRGHLREAVIVVTGIVIAALVGLLIANIVASSRAAAQRDAELVEQLQQLQQANRNAGAREHYQECERIVEIARAAHLSARPCVLPQPAAVPTP